VVGASLGHFAPALGRSLDRPQRRAACRESGAVHVERFVDDREAAHHGRVGDRVAEPQPRQPVQLRKAAQEDHGAALPDVPLAREPRVRWQEVAVRLVDHGDAAVGERVEERLPL
jgi:hypothetical protein